MMLVDLLKRITMGVSGSTPTCPNTRFPYYITGLPKQAVSYETIDKWIDLAGELGDIIQATLDDLDPKKVARSATRLKTRSKSLYDLLTRSRTGWDQKLVRVRYGKTLTDGRVDPVFDKLAVVAWFKQMSTKTSVGGTDWPSTQSVFRMNEMMLTHATRLTTLWDEYTALKDIGYGVLKMVNKDAARNNIDYGECIITTCFMCLGVIVSLGTMSVNTVSKSMK